ncbi:hypothetical protein GRF29_161g552674 [Pseudopithomyces chartarum]|uniref:Uncharacterized protein n=1 Tax=Pseudopithomyces chartarum TaxID=1892770 RepID=A0AAN6LSZ2_9PLEO|nr:hypothetical protein GRF29_161g552674 [Pseudopithomyces chartarum]
MPYAPPKIKVSPRPSMSSTDDDDESDAQSRKPRFDRLGGNGSPIIPPKSPSRPDVRAGTSQEDLVARFYAVTRERDALRKELQRKSLGPHGDLRASVVYKSDEKALIEDLLGLREEIRIWSEEYFTGPVSPRRRPHIHSAKELFSSLTDNYPSYLKHQQDRPLLIQGFLWYILPPELPPVVLLMPPLSREERGPSRGVPPVARPHREPARPPGRREVEPDVRRYPCVEVDKSILLEDQAEVEALGDAEPEGEQRAVVHHRLGGGGPGSEDEATARGLPLHYLDGGQTESVLGLWLLRF